MKVFQPTIQAEVPRSYLECPDCDLWVSDLDFASVLGDSASRGYYEAIDTENLEAKFERVMAMGLEQSDNWGRVLRYKAFVSDLRSQYGLVKACRLLDVGSGSGVFAARWQIEGPEWSITCLEPDSRACEWIKQKTNCHTICGTISQLPAKDTFDMITLNRVLEHLPNPLQSVRELVNHLAPGGVLALEVPDRVCYAKYGAGASEFGLEHLTIWSVPSLLKLMSASGLVGLRAGCFSEPSGKISAVVVGARLVDMEVRER